ncbi:sigma factor-like helix-turn-helix DNA-binding protein [Brevibacterium spongiae]|uniref:RNA polymerase subunit sigma-70 n=1 Tax=Brevibacterium spongiae TaxID=2909672 RepID=A0ABY5STZ2_9MICO|nr:sigma factor-like helix-turn-helix DNA-binding protein [Brevibacterium spongiae]UVI36501.1 RNA polymerase subunit sigma-70 [Brevibacterium spongiae]
MNSVDTDTPATRAWGDHRSRLFGIAYRMLGDVGLAEDVVSEVGIAAVVQERKSATVQSWPGWLTTVCVRRSIDEARHLESVKEEYPGAWLPEPVATEALPDEALANKELLSVTLLHLADQLTPEARAAVVLARAFDVPTGEISSILGKSAAAVRQMISRAERRLDLDRHTAHSGNRQVIDRLVDAIRSGDQSGALRLLLADDAIFWSDGGGLVPSTRNPLFGNDRIIRFLTAVIDPDDPTSQQVTGVVDVNGEPAIAVTKDAGLRVLAVEIDEAGLVAGLRQVNNPHKLERLRAGVGLR